MSDYEDIINLDHYELRYHPRMSMESRAAQFASFDALMTYKEEIKETARTTTNKKILSEEEIDSINKIINTLKKKDKVIVKYFLPDMKKRGGKYITYEGIIKDIINTSREIVFQDKTKIKMNQIIDIKRCMI